MQPAGGNCSPSKDIKLGSLSVAFSPDGRQILTGSLDNSAKLWDAANGRELLSLTGHTDDDSVGRFFSQRPADCHGQWDKTAKVWDAVTGQQVLTFRGHSAPINSLAFSPDDLRIVTGSEDQTAKVWEPTTGRELATLAGHSVPLRTQLVIRSPFHRTGDGLSLAESMAWPRCGR